MNTWYDPLTNRTLTKRPDASVIDGVFSNSEFNSLAENIESTKESSFLEYDRSFGRFGINSLSRNCPQFLREAHQHVESVAREIFSPTLRLSYCLFVSYQGFRARLPRHVDDNACTYTIDLCVSHKMPWPLYVEDIEFVLEPSQAVAYYGEDQYHWRNEFPNPGSNSVDMIFFHFVEPTHWWFAKGRQYLEEITQKRESYQRMIGIQE